MIVEQEKCKNIKMKLKIADIHELTSFNVKILHFDIVK